MTAPDFFKKDYFTKSDYAYICTTLPKIAIARAQRQHLTFKNK
jgi:hypothetical protein